MFEIEYWVVLVVPAPSTWAEKNWETLYWVPLAATLMECMRVQPLEPEVIDWRLLELAPLPRE